MTRLGRTKSMQDFFSVLPNIVYAGAPLARSGRLIPIYSGQKLDLWSSTLEYTHCSARSLFNLYAITLDYVLSYVARKASVSRCFHGVHGICKREPACSEYAYTPRLLDPGYAITCLQPLDLLFPDTRLQPTLTVDVPFTAAPLFPWFGAYKSKAEECAPLAMGMSGVLPSCLFLSTGPWGPAFACRDFTSTISPASGGLAR